MEPTVVVGVKVVVADIVVALNVDEVAVSVVVWEVVDVAGGRITARLPVESVVQE